MAFFVLVAVLAVFLLLAAVALASRVFVRVRLAKSGTSDRLTVVGRALFGLVRFQLVIPSFKMRGLRLVYDVSVSVDVAGRSFRKLRRETGGSGTGTLRLVRRLAAKRRQWKWMMAVLRHVTCTRWRLEVGIGTGDAASTGVAAGLAWMLLGLAAGATSRLVRLATRPRGEVRPDFQREELSLIWEADFHIIPGALAFVLLRMLFRNGPVRRWRWRKGRRAAQQPAVRTNGS
jgi:hypothetical protein